MFSLFRTTASSSPRRTRSTYVYESDTALSAASTIFRSRARIGDLDPRKLDEHQRANLGDMANVDIVLYDGGKGGSFGHFYFRESPAVSSDVLLWMRYGLLPGAENGRPLQPMQERVWRLNDEYLKEPSASRGTPACN